MTITQAERRWPNLTDREREIIVHLDTRQKKEVSRVHRQYRAMIAQVQQEYFNKGHDAGMEIGITATIPRNPGTMAIKRPEGVRAWSSMTDEEREAVLERWIGKENMSMSL